MKILVCVCVFWCVYSERRDQETSGSDRAELVLPYSSWRRSADVSSKWKTHLKSSAKDPSGA